MDAAALEGKEKLAKAILQVMKKVKSVEKNSTVGSGQSQYKGVNDADLKEKLNEALTAAGLCFLPIDVDAEVKIERWEETYNNVTKPKQSVLTIVETKYLLLHESGQSIILAGYGHGIDSQDKSAGKATTYALKYTLLYTFLIATGKIDDADNHHSDEAPLPPADGPKTQAPAAEKKEPIELTDEKFQLAMKAPDKELKGTLSAITKGHVLASTEQILELQNEQQRRENEKGTWITKEQIDIAIGMGEKGIVALQKRIEKGTIKARDAEKKQLEDALAKLKEKK